MKNAKEELISLNLASENAFFPSAQMANLFYKVSPALGVASGSSGLRSDGRRPIARRRRCSFRLGTHKPDVLTCVPTAATHRTTSRCSFGSGLTNVNAYFVPALSRRHRLRESQAVLTCAPTNGEPSQDVADAASGSRPANVNAYFVPCAKWCHRH
ncbi:hypothetical protein pipiens_005187 [Culex pipiens pipiens]|uniref:Uncharacterized protein n=1 Tax=Culex pipiens pipiens TaxID=38569 RepID=A0ABD1CAL3_CULPP